jgi:cytidylate kinase
MTNNMKAGEKPRPSMVICVCGMAGSGKSTAARKLAKKYGLNYVSGGDALKALAIDRGYRPRERGWWESGEGLRFLEERRKDRGFDKAIDGKLLDYAREGNIVLDSWTMPWLLEKGLKIWLEVSLENRAKRIAKRDGMSEKEALKALESKEKQTKRIYKELYGFSLGEDFKPFHLILDTDDLEAEEVFQILCMAIDNCMIE